MPLFLNTDKLNIWLPKLIEEAEEELIIIVPYIQTSKSIFTALKKADKKRVIITLIYRENKLSIVEKDKLLSLNHINLLHHPNIHCKCYYNGDLLITGSMNLYEYSEKNNREMGVLFSRSGIEYQSKGSDIIYSYSDDKIIFDDAIIEIKEIVNGARLEKITPTTRENSFEINIIKTDEELEYDKCNKLNKYFLNKKFKPFEYSANNYHSRCENFFDRVEVTFEGHRAAIKFNLSKSELKRLHQAWNAKENEYEFDWFKYYWNGYHRELLLYRNTDFNWEDITDDAIFYGKVSAVLDQIINKYRRLTGK